MKKQLFTLLMSGLALSGFAQVVPATGAVEPQTSTADEPVWYAMMSSHIDVADRKNRWMYYDGTDLGTTQFTADGLGADADQTQYAWRLEEYNDGFTDGVRLIHYSGKEVLIPPTAEGTQNTELQMNDGTGSLWKLMLASETGQEKCAENQYVLTYPHATMSPYLFLNAMDGTGGTLPWGITVYNAGAHQASGWFFVPLTIEGEEPEEPEGPSWENVYSNTLSYNSAGDERVSLEDPIYVKGSWSMEGSSASAVLLEEQADNNKRYGPYIKTPASGDYISVKVANLEPGTYKFSFLHKRGASGSVNVYLTYGTKLTGQRPASDFTLEVPELKGSEAGNLVESKEFEIAEAGEYYFTYNISGPNPSSTKDGLKIRVADFNLYKLEVPAVTYTVTWDAPANGELAVSAGEQSLTSPATVEEGTELTITATPVEGYVLEGITVNDTPLDGNTWVVDGDAAIAATFVEEPVEPEDPNTAIQMFGATAGGRETQHNRFSFDDALLGSHTNGSRDNDQRSYTFTMSAWVKVNEARGRVMGYGQKGWWCPGPTFNLYIEDGNYKLYNRMMDSGNGVNNSQDEALNQAVETGEWAFLTVVFDETNKTRTFYYNGEQKFTGKYDETMLGLGMLQDESEFYVIDGIKGNNANYTDDPALDLDEVQVWSKALTAEEVKASMNDVDPASEGLIYLYRFGADKMNEDYTFNNQATSSAVTSQVTGSYVTGTIGYSPTVYTSVLTGSVTQPTFVPGHNYVEPVETYAINWNVVDHATITVSNAQDESIVYTNGQEVEEGTYINIVVEPEAGYTAEVTVNDVPFDYMWENPYQVSKEDVNIVVTVSEAVTHTVTYSVDEEGSDLGSLEVLDFYTNEEFNSGDAVTEEDALMFVITRASEEVGVEVYFNDELSEEFSTAPDGYWEDNMTMFPLEMITEDMDVRVKFYTAETPGPDPQMYTVTWEGDNCTIAVSESSYQLLPVTNGGKVEEGTIIEIEVTPAQGFTVESIEVNGEPLDGKLYKVVSDTHIVVKTVGTGLNGTEVSGAYYDADAEMLYLGGEQALKIYDVTGRMVVDTLSDGTYSVADLRDGIYVAVVNGKVIKFRK